MCNKTVTLLLFDKRDDTLGSPVPVGDLLHIAYRLNPPCISVSCILVEPALHQFHERIGNMLPVVRIFILVNRDRKSTRLNSSHVAISYAVFCLKKKKNR